MSGLNCTKFVKDTEKLTRLYKFILDFQQTATIQNSGDTKATQWLKYVTKLWTSRPQVKFWEPIVQMSSS